MDFARLHERLAAVEARVREALPTVASADAVRRLDSEILGKNGDLGSLISAIREFPPDQRGQVGQAVNAAKQRVKTMLDQRLREIQSAEAGAEATEAAAFDPTLPGTPEPMGSVHPVTAVQWEIERLFERLGFTVEAGPEMETEYHNFEALNIPATHPARDMQDTFWLTNGMVLRTHTSPVQHRSMIKFGAPLRVIVPGRCFRYETIDASHENTFHQVEGLMIDRDISIPNLIAMAKMLLEEVMKRPVELRVRPGYFPFVEPGLEIDMNCQICSGKTGWHGQAELDRGDRGHSGGWHGQAELDHGGEEPSVRGCPTCKYSGWIEILPCGMVHPNVLRAGGIDPDEFTGFAFGLGLTRLAMMKYGIRDIRVLNSGDLRALVSPRRFGGTVVSALSSMAART
jgi:phenylalanyl-tRNA synthetase alpha chain